MAFGNIFGGGKITNPFAPQGGTQNNVWGMAPGAGGGMGNPFTGGRTPPPPAGFTMPNLGGGMPPFLGGILSGILQQRFGGMGGMAQGGVHPGGVPSGWNYDPELTQRMNRMWFGPRGILGAYDPVPAFKGIYTGPRGGGA